MSYALIDPLISAWALENKLTVYTEYQDTEVRSIDVVNSIGRRFQIWIDRPQGGMVAVHAWDYKKKRQNWVGTVSELERFLQEALATVKSW